MASAASFGAVEDENSDFCISTEGFRGGVRAGKIESKVDGGSCTPRVIAGLKCRSMK